MKVVTINDCVYKISNSEFDELEKSLNHLEKLRENKYGMLPENYDSSIKSWRRAFRDRLRNIQNKYESKLRIDKSYQFPKQM